MTYTDIITRLEAAGGADRELDAVIMCAIGGARRISETAFYGPNEKSWSFGEHEDESNAWCGPLPYVTASLDASLALVSEKFPGAGFGVLSTPKQHDIGAQAYVNGHPDMSGSGSWHTAPTPSLAVLLALFKALQGEEAK